MGDGPRSGHFEDSSSLNHQINMRMYYQDKRYYGPGGKDQYIREVGRGEGFGRDYLLDRGARPDRYYGPGDDRKNPRSRLEIQEFEDDTPYEGPTIFDKVYGGRRTSADEKMGSRSRSQSPSTRRSSSSTSRENKSSRTGQYDENGAEIDEHWLEYKQKTEAKIRREKDKLMKYEEKIQELTRLGRNQKVRGQPLDIEKYERRKRRLEHSRESSSSRRSKFRCDEDGTLRPPSPAHPPPPSPPPGSPPPGLPQEPPRHMITPPPGANLRPVLTPEGDGEYISDDEYDTRYSEFVSRTGGVRKTSTGSELY